MLAERSKHPRLSAPFSCVAHLLEHQARRIPEAPAILAPGRAPLTYGRLYQHIDEVGRALRAMGIGHRDRIVVVLPNGPEMAVAVFAVAMIAACAPLNPVYGSEELDRYLADLRPHALIALAGIDSPARRAALSRGIRVIELSTAFDSEAGLFALTGDHGSVQCDEPVSSAGDVALLLPTSGTTSRPKIVPLTHANICASAYASGAALALTETDRCLNIVPLFHSYGLNATVLNSLAIGASVVCVPGCDVNSFFAWLTRFRPTWYSGVPTMHQAILAHARHNGLRAPDSGLRFIRSATAPLPQRILDELEWTFGTSVIEFYGMTETASSPIACSKPHRRKSGSVGVKVALDVAIMDEGGALMPPSRTGQVVVRGESVMSGYDGNEIATQAAFAGDWFKTGDIGFFDDDGYLFLAGRISEIINRGGEKVAPREVDELLLKHPAVEEAVTFPVPHATLGEDVASAVVLRPDAVATAKDIRQFAIGRIAEFKIPRQILIVREIPKGPTGKVQRIGLAAKLGFEASTDTSRAFVAPRTELEKVLAKHWAEILQVEQIGIHDDFFAAGGDSLLATDVLSHVFDITQVELEVSRFFEAPTVAEVAHHLEQLIDAGQAFEPSSAIVHAPRENGMVTTSIGQEQFCKLQHALPDLPFFNILHALRLTSPCDIAVLERSINEIVRRHEILRTTFAHIDGQYVQVIAPQSAVPLAFDDLRGLPSSKKETIGHQLIQEEVLHSFDLAKGPLIRARLVHLAKQEHLFLISMHQVVCDGWSLGVFVEELVALYDAFLGQGESPLAPLSIQYADFAHWQRRWRLHSEIIAQLEYWQEQLREPSSVVPLARSGPRRAIDDLRTARRAWTLPASLAEAAKRFSRQEGGTLYMALVAALKTLLHRYLGEDDVRVATNVANRNRPGTEALIGPLVNTVILRTNLGGDPSAREVMRRVRSTVLAAVARQDLPFEELVQTLERERRLAPLANAMIIFQNSALRPTVNSGHKLTFEEANPNVLVPLVTITSFDVILMLRESPHGLAGTCVYKPHLFQAATIDRLLRDFQEVLARMTAHPEQPISTICVALNEQTSNG
ncbi:condensation domain-containing protein [Bradyrhizobium australiense]|uniref:AMP-binding protein n=1 Tax=Bradyrhizobium australiense TaxID=2721161 RepID=A0A7Y4GRB3_9BRAD|nr:condensation domain-containing protein [Bradyrhizobium australiense]NOJ39987.1 AMP-binding protein [Bradyrhizobium australiense]